MTHRLFSWLRLMGDSAVYHIPLWKGRTRRVLIVRLDGIGDFFLWVDAAQGLRDFYHSQGLSVTLATTAACGETAKRLKLADEYLLVDPDKFRKNLAYRIAVLLRIHFARYEKAVDPVYSRNPLIGDAMIRVSRANECIGFHGNDDNMPPKMRAHADSGYSRLIFGHSSDPWEYSNNNYFNDAIGAPFRAIDREVLRNAEQEVSDTRIAETLRSQRYFVVFPGSSWDGRRWPVGQFAQIVDLAYQGTGWKCVICGARSDNTTISNLESLLPEMQRLNLGGKTSLSELIWVIRRAEFLVTNETSAVHIASITQTPAVVIVGGGYFGRFVPYSPGMGNGRLGPKIAFSYMDCFGCKWKCIYEVRKGSPMPCIEGVSADVVWSEVEAILKSKQAGQLVQR